MWFTSRAAAATRLGLAGVWTVWTSLQAASPKAARASREVPGARATQSAIPPRPTRLLVREEPGSPPTGAGRCPSACKQLMRVCREDPGLWAPATLKLIFPPAAQTPPSQIYAARIESVKRLRLCLTPWPWRVRCASCMYGVHVVRHPGSTAVVSSSGSSSTTGGALVTPYRTIAIPQTNTKETNACTSPASPAFFPFDGLSDATRRRITRRSAVSAPRSQVGQPLAAMSHRTPSPSVRPVTRERSPKRVLQVVCGWCTGACWLPRLGLECPGSILPSFDPPCRQAYPGLPSWAIARCLHRVAARCLAAVSDILTKPKRFNCARTTRI